MGLGMSTMKDILVDIEKIISDITQQQYNYKN